MIARLRAFGAFWYDFVVGDDWRIAAGVAATLALTAVLSLRTTASWWLVLLAVAVLLPMSLLAEVRRTARSSRPPASAAGSATVPE